MLATRSTKLDRLIDQTEDVVLRPESKHVPGLAGVDAKILAQTSRLFGVYVFDRRQVTHCCSLSGSYWLTFLGTQWQPLSDLNDQQCEDLADAIQEGDCQCDGTNYFDVADVERMIAQPCRKYFLPEGAAGGFHVDVSAVVTDDAVAEIEEAYRGSEL